MATAELKQRLPGEPAEPSRATQGFVAIISWLRSRPAPVMLEIAWRWAFGIPALLLCAAEGKSVLAAVPWQGSGIATLTVNQLLTDPPSAAAEISIFAEMIAPGLVHALQWMVPTLLIAWVVISAVGRGFVLHAMDRTLHRRTGTLLALQTLRMLPIVVFAALWLLLLHFVTRSTVTAPAEAGSESPIMLFVGAAIALTLGLFVVASVAGYPFTLAPLLAMRNNTGTWASLRQAFAYKRVRGQLIEINLVLGIVKIALLVIAVVFSATPLPFQSVLTDDFLFWWNVAVTIVYCIASDFFHAARLAGYLHFISRAKVTPDPLSASQG